MITLAITGDELINLVEEIHGLQDQKEEHLPENCPACRLIKAYSSIYPPVPVSRKLAEAFFAIRANIAARDSLAGVVEIIEGNNEVQEGTALGALLKLLKSTIEILALSETIDIFSLMKDNILSTVAPKYVREDISQEIYMPQEVEKQ